MLERYLFGSLHVTVTKEGSKEAAVEVVQDHHQEVLVELKRIRKLQHNQSLYNIEYIVHGSKNGLL